jgi:sodium/proline symporter
VTGFESGETTTVAVVMGVYLACLLAIGWFASRRTHGGEDFHLAGRSLGAWAAGISSTASSESGWVTLGAVGMTYVHGVAGLWFAPGCLLGYLVNVFLVAPRLRELSATDGSVTLTDVLTRRWGDPRNVLRVVATTIVIVCMMGYVAAQMTAAGKAFSSSLGLEGRGGYLTGVFVGAIVITLVTTLGGFRAVAWTDLFQGLLMAVALVALPAYAIVRFGGFGELTNALGALDPSLLTATGNMAGAALFGFVVGNLGIGLGYPGMPHVVTRYMAASSAREVRRLRVIAIIWGVVVFYGAGLVGLVGRAMHPDLPDGEQTLMVLARELTHPVIAGLLLAAVLSAVLSTVSSQLLVAASAMSYDLVEETLGRASDDRRSLVLGRWTVAVVGAMGVLVALTEVRLVFWFVLFAWSGLGAAFAPLVLLALTRRQLVNRHGALAAMLTGVGVTVVWKLGRDAATAPEPYAAAWWVVLVVAAAILLGGRFRGLLEVADRGAVLAATVLTLAAWWVVGHSGLDHLYELVPAFAAATVAAIAVSRALPEATGSEGPPEGP